MIKEYTHKMLAKGRLHKEDKCAALSLAHECEDSLNYIREAYRRANL